MDTVGGRLKVLRATTGLSQQALADIAGTKQSTINRYENDASELPYRILLWYADYFDVSLDYIFCRTDKPQGKLYEFRPRMSKETEQMKAFIEMCFDPKSPMNEKLKQTLLNMLAQDDDIK
ncbi:MAG: helix-turn-helix domain-containing protein [Oscillospiraceae bacterium]|nr:helix-turn-helix domain-containing protein [Oscillospiraceae bacterium]